MIVWLGYATSMITFQGQLAAPNFSWPMPLFESHQLYGVNFSFMFSKMFLTMWYRFFLCRFVVPELSYPNWHMLVSEDYAQPWPHCPGWHLSLLRIFTCLCVRLTCMHDFLLGSFGITCTVCPSELSIFSIVFSSCAHKIGWFDVTHEQQCIDCTSLSKLQCNYSWINLICSTYIHICSLCLSVCLCVQMVVSPQICWLTWCPSTHMMYHTHVALILRYGKLILVLSLVLISLTRVTPRASPVSANWSSLRIVSEKERVFAIHCT